MQRRRGVGVVLAVAHTRARAHELHAARSDNTLVAERVLVRKLPVEHVRHDLHIAMWVCRKSCPTRNRIVVEDA